jgi:hypothetical protein
MNRTRRDVEDAIDSLCPYKAARFLNLKPYVFDIKDTNLCALYYSLIVGNRNEFIVMINFGHDLETQENALDMLVNHHLEAEGQFQYVLLSNIKTGLRIPDFNFIAPFLDLLNLPKPNEREEVKS